MLGDGLGEGILAVTDRCGFALHHDEWDSVHETDDVWPPGPLLTTTTAVHGKLLGHVKYVAADVLPIHIPEGHAPLAAIHSGIDRDAEAEHVPNGLVGSNESFVGRLLKPSDGTGDRLAPEGHRPLFRLDPVEGAEFLGENRRQQNAALPPSAKCKSLVGRDVPPAEPAKKYQCGNLTGRILSSSCPVW